MEIILSQILVKLLTALLSLQLAIAPDATQEMRDQAFASSTQAMAETQVVLASMTPTPIIPATSTAPQIIYTTSTEPQANGTIISENPSTGNMIYIQNGKQTLGSILSEGEKAIRTLDKKWNDWYNALFSPSLKTREATDKQINIEHLQLQREKEVLCNTYKIDPSAFVKNFCN